MVSNRKISRALFLQETEAYLTLECERAVEEERVKADQIEEQKTVAELQNELLTEMVAAEQVRSFYDPVRKRKMQQRPGQWPFFFTFPG